MVRVGKKAYGKALSPATTANAVWANFAIADDIFFTTFILRNERKDGGWRL